MNRLEQAEEAHYILPTVREQVEATESTPELEGLIAELQTEADATRRRFRIWMRFTIGICAFIGLLFGIGLLAFIVYRPLRFDPSVLLEFAGLIGPAALIALSTRR